MKKIIPLFLLILFAGCEKKFDTVIDTSSFTYRVTSIKSFPVYKYAIGDSLLTLNIGFNSSDNITAVYFDIYSSARKKLNSAPVRMFDSGLEEHGDEVKGDNIYSNKFPLSQSDPNGMYEVRYFVSDKSASTNQVATIQFMYDNSQENVPPVISNLVAPDSAALGATAAVPIFLSVDAFDENGADDIELVFFNSFLPNGSPSSGNPFVMYDDGTNGDIAAGDGTYSLVVGLPPTAAKGTYHWEFQARDRTKTLSNQIIHNIVIY